MDFEDDKVRRLSIRTGDRAHVFERQEDRWVYQTEPDLPLDSKKIDNLLLQVRDLRTDRYVSHIMDDPAMYGLTDPFHEVVIWLEDDTSRVLWVSSEQGDDGTRTNRGFYATVKGVDGVFLLTADSVKRFEISLDELEEPR